MGRLFFAFFIDGGNGNEVAAGGIEQGSPQDWQCLARVLRRRPWEPPQSRWASHCQGRTTCESPKPAQKKSEKKHGLFLPPRPQINQFHIENTACFHLKTQSSNRMMPTLIANGTRIKVYTSRKNAGAHQGNVGMPANHHIGFVELNQTQSLSIVFAWTAHNVHHKKRQTLQGKVQKFSALFAYICAVNVAIHCPNGFKLPQIIQASGRSYIAGMPNFINLSKIGFYIFRKGTVAIA